MTALRLRPFGNSVGAVLPKGLLTRLRLGEGDALDVTETPDGVQPTPLEAALQEQSRVGRGTCWPMRA